jgi:ribose transport system ATP-binding protein
MSRGHAVATLEGDAVTEERIVHAAISATTHTAERAARRASGLSRIIRFIEGDYAPVVVLAAVMFVLGAYVLSQNGRYLSSFNINSVMFACAALGFISLGQTFALLPGGIDLSVGPLAASSSCWPPSSSSTATPPANGRSDSSSWRSPPPASAC